MAVTVTVTRIGPNTHRLTLASTLPPPVTFYVYKSGILVVSTSLDTYDVFSFGEPVIDVFDDPNQRPRESLPDHFLLAWLAVPATAAYRIEKFAGSWSEFATVDDTGESYFVFNTGALADVTVHQFRIIPVGDNGNDGTAQAFSALMVRAPDGAAVSWSYSNATGKVTLS